MYVFGRPPIYDSPEEMIPKLNVWAEKLEQGEKPTVTGLVMALGFESKDTLYAYRDKPDFSYLIKQALNIIENHHEKRMDDIAVTGSIFVLKNMGWKDKTESDTNMKIQGANIQLVLPKDEN